MVNKSKIIALIGGAGFIGHNLALTLKKRGHVPIIIDSLAINNILSFTDIQKKNRKLYWRILNQRMDLLHDNGIEINVEDARNYNAMSKIISHFNPDIIIQLAAVSHANKSNKDPHSTFDHTLRTLENTLDIAKNIGSHVIYFSSSMVYGNFKSKEVDEDTTCNPIGIYGTLKYAGELIVKSYHQVFDLPYTIIRPSALYGERCVSRRVSQVFLESAVQNNDITINGDGEDLLDFTYIEDLCTGINLVIEKKEAKNETFNLTYGKAHSIGQMAKILKNNFPSIKINYSSKDNLTPDRGTLKIKKARELLGYDPKYSINKGFTRYINWYKNFWNSLNET